MLNSYEDLFNPVVPGAADGVEHFIETKDDRPIACRMRRIPLNDQKIIEQEVLKMLEAGVIEKSRSAFRFPVVLADKKDGEKRFCVNYRKLNEVTVKNKHPLPLIEDLLDRTAGSKFFCVLDMSSAYWQIPLAEKDRHKTAFSTNSGHYEFKVMPFGLSNAPATQQESMRRVLCGIPKVDVLLDDIIIHGKDEDEVLASLEKVFQRLRENRLRLKMKKCSFMRKEITYLGYVIGADDRKLDPRKKRSRSILFRGT